MLSPTGALVHVPIRTNKLFAICNALCNSSTCSDYSRYGCRRTSTRTRKKLLLYSTVFALKLVQQPASSFLICG